MGTSPGSAAWQTAVREAERVAANVPWALWAREPSSIDAAIVSFAALTGDRSGRVKFVSFESSGTGVDQ